MASCLWRTLPPHPTREPGSPAVAERQLRLQTATRLRRGQPHHRACRHRLRRCCGRVRWCGLRPAACRHGTHLCEASCMRNYVASLDMRAPDQGKKCQTAYAGHQGLARAGASFCRRSLCAIDQQQPGHQRRCGAQSACARTILLRKHDSCAKAHVQQACGTSHCVAKRHQACACAKVAIALAAAAAPAATCSRCVLQSVVNASRHFLDLARRPDAGAVHS